MLLGTDLFCARGNACESVPERRSVRFHYESKCISVRLTMTRAMMLMLPRLLSLVARRRVGFDESVSPSDCDRGLVSSGPLDPLVALKTSSVELVSEVKDSWCRDGCTLPLLPLEDLLSPLRVGEAVASLSRSVVSSSVGY